MNDTTFKGNGKIAYVPVVINAKPKTITNADRIRAMTDEELDKFLGEVQWDVVNYFGGVTPNQDYPVPEQRGAWLDWLQKEVNDGKEEKEENQPTK